MATLQCSRCGGTRYDTSHRCEKGCGVMTASNEVESLRERLEQVEAERDAFEDMAKGMSGDLSAIGEERDALAAYVERVMKAPATDEILEEIHRRAGKEWSGDFTVTIARDDYAAFEAEQEALLNDMPTTSLARRDARVKAEALEALANSLNLSFDRNIISKNGILEKAAEYRQQAERGDDE